MKANEFRAGNILQYYIGEEGQMWVRTKLDWQDLKWCAENNEDFNKVHRPVPLTEELLLKCGFEKVGSNYEKDWLLLHTHLERKTYDFLLYESKSGKLKATPILHLHQLQNLVFVLTGQELEINL